MHVCLRRIYICMHVINIYLGQGPTKEGCQVIFTGGDSQLLSIPTKNSIFANSNFLLEGLNFILEFKPDYHEISITLLYLYLITSNKMKVFFLLFIKYIIYFTKFKY